MIRKPGQNHNRLLVYSDAVIDHRGVNCWVAFVVDANGRRAEGNDAVGRPIRHVGLRAQIWVLIAAPGFFPSRPQLQHAAKSGQLLVCLVIQDSMGKSLVL